MVQIVMRFCSSFVCVEKMKQRSTLCAKKERETTYGQMGPQQVAIMCRVILVCSVSHLIEWIDELKEHNIANRCRVIILTSLGRNTVQFRYKLNDEARLRNKFLLRVSVIDFYLR